MRNSIDFPGFATGVRLLFQFSPIDHDKHRWLSYRLAELVAKETPVIEIIAPWLTLDGLRIIWELNK